MVAEMTVPTSSRSGKKTSNSSMPASISLASAGGGQFAVGVDQHFAGGHIHHVGDDVSAFQIVDGHFHLRDLGLLNFLDQRWR